MAVELTDTAVREVKKICQDQNLDLGKTFLRVGVKGGGCSGFSYLLDLTEQAAEDDWKFNKDDLTIVCDQKSYLYLNGITVDFRDEIMGRGFVFNNPNATSSCGCGHSFSV